jgi:hypothetical protein
MNKICSYCDRTETKDNPIKEHNGEMVCYECRKDWIENEYFPPKVATEDIPSDEIPF